MLEEVLNDVKADYEMLSRSGFSAQSALDAMRSVVMNYLTTGRIDYANGVRMASSVIFLLVKHRDGGKQNGMAS